LAEKRYGFDGMRMNNDFLPEEFLQRKHSDQERKPGRNLVDLAKEMFLALG